MTISNPLISLCTAKKVSASDARTTEPLILTGSKIMQEDGTPPRADLKEFSNPLISLPKKRHLKKLGNSE